MDFKEAPYTRPDFDQIKTSLATYTTALKGADDPDTALAAATAANQLINDYTSQAMLAQIRHSIDTNDEFYNKEDDYWNTNGPLYENEERKYKAAVVASPYQEVLGQIYPKPDIMSMQNDLKMANEAIIPLQQKNNALVSEYAKLVASAQIDFQGKTLTLAQLGPYRESADRATRKAATEAYWGFFADHEADFDRIYDDMVKVRTEIAHTLGYPDYSALSYVYMNRFGYDEPMVAQYRKTVLEKVVPLTQKQYAKQAKRLGLAKLAYYDLPVAFKSGNAKPTGTPDELVATAQQMYNDLSPETGDLFALMVKNHLFDLLAKKGKQSGGYCEYIPSLQAPFIFANFNGTSGDVDVLTHEFGHAFQTYSSRWIKDGLSTFPTFEAAEIFSMSMEFITYPWMKGFFGAAEEKYKYNHLEAALEFLPYGILVDHFQHEIYTHPEWTPAERKACWRDLEKQYNPERDYSENEALERGIYFFRQGHIFESPFYYLDYTIAQVLAYQFWKRFNVDHDPQAWADYTTMAKAGGSQTLMELIQTGHLASPFEPGALDDTLTAISQALDGVDDQALDK
ncbi:M3 family oligoendopeptidase [Schleiferilactobacillus harbinensis]|uniref:M3 family oligoendopeptidase n=1 Tax=Schleiferilactobacillus harbinensis TaxID=304207 RepID=A0A510TTX7_9LACO|nr:M3 family oligoendopeptidase [Schleiferilactobacillus harbinensis]MBO3090950.1 M3 family oligoendopeptidase [Schleiferilactobacillus harbinensis]QFR22369.1 M3 family oligoendopeptidase [Schleiferilactobacillus harbinensis]GEK05729.1 M3 family oligoendopeptidase [Schleiferilactobacillus harbinensis]